MWFFSYFKLRVYQFFAFLAKARVKNWWNGDSAPLATILSSFLIGIMILGFAFVFLLLHSKYMPNYQHVHSRLFSVFECFCVCVLLEWEPTCSLLSVKRGISHGYWKLENIFKVNICAWDCFHSKSEYPHETVNIYCNLWRIYIYIS